MRVWDRHMDKNERRYQRTWSFLQATLGWALRSVFAFSGELFTSGEEPYLVVINHNTDLDPALVALSFPKQMYYVASEHAFRKGFSSWLLTYLFAPISRMKGTTDAAAALNVIRRIRNGDNVALFAEGNRSYSGVTGPIFPATGKLAKSAGATLVTYRLEGGYLTTPRWGHTLRRGRMRGYCVNAYTPEQLKAMPPEEINAHISEDLFEDAFLRQQSEPEMHRFRGKALAEGLEYALYFCPQCDSFGTMHSRGDRFWCGKCGLSMRFAETGFFEGENLPFDTVRDWDAWQDGRLLQFADALGEGEEAFGDDGIKLLEVNQKHRSRALLTGRLSMSRDSLMIGERAFPIAHISDIGLMGTYKLMFSADGALYELRPAKGGFCGRKYFQLYQILKKER